MKGPYAILTPCKQSHPFDERKVKVGPENDPLKIGRAVARLKPQSNNAIFDCKVLSRNHAVLYYENEQFYIRDTKSSNGTFLNNERLAVTGEESEPKEVYSGDILQFGVEIVENINNKVTHGCIHAFVRVYDDKGAELSPPLPTLSRGSSEETITHQSLLGAHQLFQLQQYIKESLYREDARKEKIRQLEAIIAATSSTSETAWKALVNEDRLLARIESLESNLALLSKNESMQNGKVALDEFISAKSAYETTFKETLKRSLEEKSEAVLRLADVERSLYSTEEECAQLRSKVRGLADVERSLYSTEEECAQLRSKVRGLADVERNLYSTEEECAQLRSKVREIADVERSLYSTEEECAQLISKVRGLADVERSLYSTEEECAQLRSKVRGLADVERSLYSTEEECAQLRSKVRGLADVERSLYSTEEECAQLRSKVRGLADVERSLYSTEEECAQLKSKARGLADVERSLYSTEEEFNASLEGSLNGTVSKCCSLEAELTKAKQQLAENIQAQSELDQVLAHKNAHKVSEASSAEQLRAILQSGEAERGESATAALLAELILLLQARLPSEQSTSGMKEDGCWEERCNDEPSSTSGKINVGKLEEGQEKETQTEEMHIWRVGEGEGERDIQFSPSSIQQQFVFSTILLLSMLPIFGCFLLLFRPLLTRFSFKKDN